MVLSFKFVCGFGGKVRLCRLNFFCSIVRVVFFLFVVPSGFIYGVNGDLGRGLLRFFRKLML